MFSTFSKTTCLTALPSARSQFTDSQVIVTGTALLDVWMLMQAIILHPQFWGTHSFPSVVPRSTHVTCPVGLALVSSCQRLRIWQLSPEIYPESGQSCRHPDLAMPCAYAHQLACTVEQR